MKRLVTFTLVLLGCQLAAAQTARQPTESELLLSGLKTAKTVKDLPHQLEIPEAWAKTMREMATRSKATSKELTEYGACLNLLASGNTEDRPALLKTYAELLKRRGEMPVSVFSLEEKTLRSKISAADSAAVGQLKWHSGEIQRGDTAGMMHRVGGLQFCKGEQISKVHSHPNSGATFFSHRDINLSTNSNFEKSDFVVNNDGHVCALINTDSTLKNSHGFDIESKLIIEATPLRLAGDDKYLSHIAYTMAERGSGIYCGNIEQPLKIVKGIRGDLTELKKDILILMAKLEFNNFEIYRGKNGALVTSEFTSLMDKTFINYVEDKLKSLPSEVNYIENFNSSSIIDDYLNLYKMALFFNVDDEWKSSESNCIKTEDRESWLCMQISGFFREKPNRVYSYFDEKKKQSSIVQNNRGELTLTTKDDLNGVLYQGGCIFVEKYCVRHGKGTLTLKNEYKYSGDFESGKMKGNGVIESYTLNEVWQVKMLGTENGDMQKIKRLR